MLNTLAIRLSNEVRAEKNELTQGLGVAATSHKPCTAISDSAGEPPSILVPS